MTALSRETWRARKMPILASGGGLACAVEGAAGAAAERAEARP